MRVALLFLLLAVTPLVLMANGTTFLFERAGIGRVYGVNLDAQAVKVDCVVPQLSAIVGQHEKNLLDPYKVKIFKDHSIVREAWSKPSILIEKTTPSGRECLLIPIESNGNRIIIIDGDAYRLVGFDRSKGTLDLSGCLK